MAKSSINLPNGTKIKIEGSAEEVAKIVSLYKAPAVPAEIIRKEKPSSRGRARKPKKGPSQYILELKESGFFKKKQTDEDVRRALDAKGHIYDRATIARTLLEFVRNKKLGRVKETVEGKKKKKKIWVYVDRA